MAQKTKLGLSAGPSANYNTSLFAGKTPVLLVAVKQLDVLPFAWNYQTNLGLALMRKPANRTYQN